MFDIVSRFKYEGKEGVTVEIGDNLQEQILIRGLYSDMNLSAMTDAGYKIYDYHGKIARPDGILISELEEVSVYFQEEEWSNILDEAEYALSEAEATQYFTREIKADGIKFAESTNEIKTREELLRYLDRCRNLSTVGMDVGDVRPLNSFVAEDALFTIEELITDNTVRYYMDIIERRRKLDSYSDYQKLVAFLQRKGVLGREFAPEDVRRAYMLWGICGLKTKVTSVQYDFGILPKITNTYNDEDKVTASSGRVCRYCLVDRDGVVHCNTSSVNLMDYDDYDLAPITPAQPEQYDNYMREVGYWETEYKVLKCYVAEESYRTSMILIGEDGSVYKGKFEHNQYCIVNAREIILHGVFLEVRGFDENVYSLEDVASSDLFRLRCLAGAKVKDIVRGLTIEPPVSNTFELCVREGVSPANAIAYAAVQAACAGRANDFIGAEALYCEGPANSVISKFNPHGYEYDNIDELIDIFCATRDELVEAGEYDPFDTGESGVDADLANRPVEKLEFARDVKAGRTSTGYINDGMLLDSSVSYDECSRLLMLMIDMKYGKDYPVESKINALSGIEDSGIADLSDVFKERHAAFNGFLRDRAELNESRARQCAAAVYVTKVFREMSNLPLDRQRHYLFVCMYLDLFDKKRNPAVKAQGKIAECICKAVDDLDSVDFDMKRYLRLEAPSIALGVMFKLAAKHVNITRDAYGNYVVPVVHPIEDVDIFRFNITISSAVYDIATDLSNYEVDKICTLYDWCSEEMTASAWNLYALNANITPWYVKPKIGVTLPVYNFKVNYIDNETMSAFSQGYQDKVRDTGAKIACLQNIYSTRYLLGNDLADCGIPYTNETIDEVLDPLVVESVRDYDDRFSMHNKKAKEAGKYLKAMRLKSDVVYENVADSVGVVPLTEDLYDVISDDGGNKRIVTLMDVEKISGGKNVLGIAGDGNVVEEFNGAGQSYEELLSRKQLILGSFVPTAVCRVVGTKLLFVKGNDKEVVELSSLTKEQADAYAAAGVFYQLGAREYLIFAGYKRYRLVVK